MWILNGIRNESGGDAYIGAKFTNYAPRMLLRFSMIMTPVLAGCMLLME